VLRAAVGRRIHRTEERVQRCSFFFISTDFYSQQVEDMYRHSTRIYSAANNCLFVCLFFCTTNHDRKYIHIINDASEMFCFLLYCLSSSSSPAAAMSLAFIFVLFSPVNVTQNTHTQQQQCEKLIFV